jgi:hypothetical protein
VLVTDCKYHQSLNASPHADLPAHAMLHHSLAHPMRMPGETLLLVITDHSLHCLQSFFAQQPATAAYHTKELPV